MNEILIVDDDKYSINALLLLLNNEGCIIKTAADGHHALEQVDPVSTELILLDISMPGMSGIEICKHLKANKSTEHIPVIFLTAHTDHEMKERAFDAGAQDYITKPFHDGETLARVRNQLNIRQHIRQIQQLHEREKSYLNSLIQIKDDFIAATTHDLKSPLAVVSLASEMIRRVGPERWDRIMDQVDRIDRAVMVMRQLVTNVLDLAQLESESPNIRVVNLRQVILEVITNLESLAEEKQISIQFEPMIVDVNIRADRLHINRILANILTNAIKYSPSGSTVFVRFNFDTQTGAVDVEIEDQGYGIVKDELNKIFDRFYRCDDRQHQREIGTGLGLTIVKSLVDRNNGEIWVKSQVGQGSLFTVRFSTAGDPTQGFCKVE